MSSGSATPPTETQPPSESLLTLRVRLQTSCGSSTFVCGKMHSGKWIAKERYVMGMFNVSSLQYASSCVSVSNH